MVFIRTVLSLPKVFFLHRRHILGTKKQYPKSCVLDELHKSVFELSSNKLGFSFRLLFSFSNLTTKIFYILRTEFKKIQILIIYDFTQLNVKNIRICSKSCTPSTQSSRCEILEIGIYNGEDIWLKVQKYPKFLIISFVVFVSANR